MQHTTPQPIICCNRYTQTISIQPLLQDLLSKTHFFLINSSSLLYLRYIFYTSIIFSALDYLHILHLFEYSVIYTVHWCALLHSSLLDFVCYILAVTVKSWQHTSEFNFICKKAVMGHAAPGFSVDLPYRGLDSLTVSFAVGKAKQGRQHFSQHREPYVAKTGLCFQNLFVSRQHLVSFSSLFHPGAPPHLPHQWL